VNGEDVTRRDLAVELDASGMPPTVDLQTIQPQLLDRVLLRKLAVEEARREEIDKTPEYLAAQQRAGEMLLASQLADRWASQLPSPADWEARNFIAANPQMFAKRTILVLDQIRTAAAGLNPKTLAPLNSNEQIVALLNSIRHPFQRGQATLDTLTLPRKTVDQINALPAGMPFVVRLGDTVLINSLIDRRPAPVPEADQLKLAKTMMERANAKTSVESRLDRLRREAEIEYQPGFAPADKAKKS
jgi:EpsD family peptidyl-prolyl cis-trans isomerase